MNEGFERLRVLIDQNPGAGGVRIRSLFGSALAAARCTAAAGPHLILAQLGAWFRKGTCYVCSMSERITLSPDICNGRPVIRGTRIAVQTVLGFLAAGDSVEDVLQEYPALSREDVQACLDYASRLMANHYSVVPAA